MARPTQSLSIFLQQAGRALRPQEHKAVLLDHAGHWVQHGLPCDARTWSLRGRNLKEKAGSPIKQCMVCFAIARAGSKICPRCRAPFPEPQGRELDHDDSQELVQLDVELLRKQRNVEFRKEVAACRNLEELIDLGKEMNFRWPREWAAHMWREQQGRKQRAARDAEAGRQQQDRAKVRTSQPSNARDAVGG